MSDISDLFMKRVKKNPLYTSSMVWGLQKKNSVMLKDIEEHELAHV